ncbi:3-deoxy-manno-octulosonate cytidylyltransferase [Chromatium okenii]|nr:3-deoxy-manno-octulosonate cytidylyltransferase [Chromatium okenii]
MLNQFKVVIPARFGSTRLPGKPLLDIGGQPMIAHVVARARASAADEIIVATDDQRIVDVCAGLGVTALLTATTHRSGSDRIAEVIERCGWDDAQIVVNVQGDEPALPSALINQVAALLATSAELGMATLAFPITDAAMLFDPQVVKVVTDKNGLALYFSRAPIPWHRDDFAENMPIQLAATGGWLRHIGLYAYRAAFLKQFVTWSPAPLEQVESLEQLRALWCGARISVAIADAEPGVGVDTQKIWCEQQRNSLPLEWFSRRENRAPQAVRG